MFYTTVIMGILAAIMLVLGYFKKEGLHIVGLKAAFDLMLQILPLLIFAFIFSSMLQLVVPKELLLKWVGQESGFKGILFGSVAGVCTPGGPFVIFPIAAGLYKTGAGTGILVAYITGWSVGSILRLPLEIGFLGWQFSFIRILSSIILPPIAGLIASLISNYVKIS